MFLDGTGPFLLRSNELRYDFQDWKPFSTLVLNNILVLCTDLFFLLEEKFRYRVLWHQAQAAIKTLNWKSCCPLWKWTAGPDHWLPTHLFVLCTSSLNIPSWWGVFRTCFNQPVGGKSSLVDSISFSHCTCLGSCLSVTQERNILLEATL